MLTFQSQKLGDFMKALSISLIALLTLSFVACKKSEDGKNIDAAYEVSEPAAVAYGEASDRVETLLHEMQDLQFCTDNADCTHIKTLEQGVHAARLHYLLKQRAAVAAKLANTRDEFSRYDSISKSASKTGDAIRAKVEADRPLQNQLNLKQTRQVGSCSDESYCFTANWDNSTQKFKTKTVSDDVIDRHLFEAKISLKNWQENIDKALQINTTTWNEKEKKYKEESINVKYLESENLQIFLALQELIQPENNRVLSFLAKSESLTSEARSLTSKMSSVIRDVTESRCGYSCELYFYEFQFADHASVDKLKIIQELQEITRLLSDRVNSKRYFQMLSLGLKYKDYSSASPWAYSLKFQRAGETEEQELKELSFTDLKKQLQ